jgi:hypothetical protein
MHKIFQYYLIQMTKTSIIINAMIKNFNKITSNVFSNTQFKIFYSIEVFNQQLIKYNNINFLLSCNKKGS